MIEYGIRAGLCGDDLGSPFTPVNAVPAVFTAECGANCEIGPNCSVADSLQAHAGIAFAIALYQSWISRPLSHPGDQATYVLKMDDLRREQVGMKEKVPEHNQAADGVLWSEERYRSYCSNLGPVAVYSCDAAGVVRFQEFNRRAVELWGCEPVLGDTDQRFCGSFKLFRPDGTGHAARRMP